MDKKNLAAVLVVLPLTVGAAGYAAFQPRTEEKQAVSAYECPITGERLPCEKCCPLNK